MRYKKESFWFYPKRLFFLLGDVLLSRDPAVQVPSALEGLTVVFGMGTRGSLPPSSPNLKVLQSKTTSKALDFYADITSSRFDNKISNLEKDMQLKTQGYCTLKTGYETQAR